MKRKLGLIQALMGDPTLIVLDEPTSGLDPLMIEAFAETIAAMRSRGRTVFLSSHVLSEVEKLCDRVALVSRGRLVKVASLAEIRDGMPRRVRIAFSNTVAAPSRLPDHVRVVVASEREWQLEMFGPFGPLLRHLHALPVEDIEIVTATLEQYVLGLYSAGEA
jgi:ABC-2 type transport system ATP-binding protein